MKAGDEVVITERGKPVAKLAALEPRSRLEELIELGIVRPAGAPKPKIDLSRLPTLGPGPALSDVVIEQRRAGRS